MNLKYELFEHTADLGVVAHGSTLEEALANTLGAMFSQIVDLASVQPLRQREIHAQGENFEIEDLVVDLLSKALLAFDADKFLSHNQTVELIRSNERIVGLHAALEGETYDPKRHHLNTDIKAVTYHEMKVWESDGGWHVRVLFDV